MYRLVSLIFIIGIVNRANGQACENTWEWTAPSSGNDQTFSVGAPATFTVSVNDAPLANNDEVVWTLKDAVLVTDTYVLADKDFTSAGNDAKVTTTHQEKSDASGNIYTITIAEGFLVAATHTGDLKIESKGCASGASPTSLPAITVKNCNLNTYGDLATATDQADTCGYNCERTFTCATDSTTTFKSKCQADATWSVPYACDVCPGATSAGVKDVAILALVMLCSALSATHLM